MIPLMALVDVGMKVLDKFIPDPEAKAKAQKELLQMQQEGRLADRWKADLASDSWLSKNIRPMSLVAIFVGYFLFAMMSAFGYDAKESYVNLLGQWGMLIMSAYFGGRTLEKIMDMKAKKDEPKQ